MDIPIKLDCQANLIGQGQMAGSVVTSRNRFRTLVDLLRTMQASHPWQISNCLIECTLAAADPASDLQITPGLAWKPWECMPLQQRNLTAEFLLLSMPCCLVGGQQNLTERQATLPTDCTTHTLLLKQLVDVYVPAPVVIRKRRDFS
jgi:hypothetical protein